MTMQIIWGSELFKVLESEIPQTYEELTKSLPDIISDPLSKEYILRYVDLNKFPVKVQDERSYKVLLEEMKKSPDQILLIIIPKEKDEKLEDMRINTLSSMLNGQTKNNNNEDLLTLGGQKQEDSSESSTTSERSIATILFDGMDEFDGDENLPQRIVVEGQSQGGLLQENKAGNHERINEVRLSRGVSSESVEFIESESNALRTGLSERIEKKGPRFSRELKALAKSQKKSKFVLKKSRKERRHDDLEEDFEVIEKKRQPLAVRKMFGNQDQGVFLKLDENLKSFREKWEDKFSVGANFEAGSMKIMAVQEKASKSRVKPNTTINDNNIQAMLDELLDKIEVQNYNSHSIQDLTLDLRNCMNLSRYALANLFNKISSHFINVRSLNLNFGFSFSQLYDFETEMIELEWRLDLKYLNKLTLNFENRSNISNKDLIAIAQSLKNNSKENLKTFTLIVPSVSTCRKDLKDDIETTLDFVQNLEIFPLF